MRIKCVHRRDAEDLGLACVAYTTEELPVLCITFVFQCFLFKHA